MEIWKTYGHKNAKYLLEKQLQNAIFPHAYLFKGPEGIGKKTLALEFAKKVLETENLENHPDYLMLNTEAEISVEEILDFISKLKFKPFLAKKKVAIINNAENLNTHSSNALLKTLEEPSQSTIIILISDESKLLPTIVSRCQVLRFKSFSLSELEEFAKLSGMVLQKEAVSLSFGKINRLKKFFENKEWLTHEHVTVKEYEDFEKSSLGQRLLFVNKYAEYEPLELKKILLLWLNWQIINLHQTEKSYKKLEVLNESILGIKMNKNKKLLLQSLFLKI